MRFVLMSDEKTIFDEEAIEIKCISKDGPFTIMDDHIPYISKIVESVIFTTKNNNTSEINIKEGFIYTNGHTCFAVVETN